MTAIVAALALLLGLALGMGTAAVSGATSSSARAQLAADAAALAAVAESVPGAGGRPREAAIDYARANGARLLECLCREGATAMQVRVAVGSTVREARAVLDPALLAPATVYGWDGLHPLLARSVETLVDRSFGRVRVVSGFRSREAQEALWSEALEEHGSAEAADDWVARPGNSMHEKGLAVDLGGDIDLAVRLIEELDLPLHRPLANEPWHFELAGARDTGA